MSEDSIFKAPPVVAVVGATGHTAHFVINELLRRKMSPVAIARNSETLAKARFSGDVFGARALARVRSSNTARVAAAPRSERAIRGKASGRWRSSFRC